MSWIGRISPFIRVILGLVLGGLVDESTVSTVHGDQFEQRPFEPVLARALTSFTPRRGDPRWSWNTRTSRSSWSGAS